LQAIVFIARLAHPILMMRYIILIVTLAILTGSCLSKKMQEDTTTPADSTDTVPPPVLESIPIDTNTAEYEEDNCVFDTSAYKFTTAALKKYKADIRFQWNKDEAKAQAIVDHGDTLWLSIGGCYHFGYSATLSTAIPFTDSAALAGKSLWLAQTFFDGGFDDKYVACISRGMFRRSETHDPQRLHHFEIIDPDTSITNYIYEGFSFENQGARTRIVISGYMN
jgi:hypothetical protein